MPSTCPTGARTARRDGQVACAHRLEYLVCVARAYNCTGTPARRMNAELQAGHEANANTGAASPRYPLWPGSSRSQHQSPPTQQNIRGGGGTQAHVLPPPPHHRTPKSRTRCDRIGYKPARACGGGVVAAASTRLPENASEVRQWLYLCMRIGREGSVADKQGKTVMAVQGYGSRGRGGGAATVHP